jgi:hypothetical protein
LATDIFRIAFNFPSFLLANAITELDLGNLVMTTGLKPQISD